jgi:hypothetical protein
VSVAYCIYIHIYTEREKEGVSEKDLCPLPNAYTDIYIYTNAHTHIHTYIHGKRVRETETRERKETCVH